MSTLILSPTALTSFLLVSAPVPLNHSLQYYSKVGFEDWHPIVSYFRNSPDLVSISLVLFTFCLYSILNQISKGFYWMFGFLIKIIKMFRIFHQYQKWLLLMFLKILKGFYRVLVLLHQHCKGFIILFGKVFILINIEFNFLILNWVRLLLTVGLLVWSGVFAKQLGVQIHETPSQPTIS